MKGYLGNTTKSVTNLMTDNYSTVDSSLIASTKCLDNLKSDIEDGDIEAGTAKSYNGVLPVENGGTGASSLDDVTVGEATKATQDGAGNVIADTYRTKTDLSFTGGELVINPTSGSTEGGQIQLVNGNNARGVYLDNVDNGAFRVFGADSAGTSLYVGTQTGSLQWGGKEVERVDSSGTNWIRFVSGLQICWGNTTLAHSTQTQVSLPVAFKDATYGIMLACSQLGFNAASTLSFGGNTTTSFKVLNSNSASASMAIAFRAIGFWK